MINSKRILEEIKKLKFPRGHYIVVGSGPMIVRNLRESNDIDIVVSNKLFNKCINNNWEIVPRTYPEKLGQFYLRYSCVELYLDVNHGNFNPTLEELLQRADIIDNIPFISLKDLIKLKKAYNKPKHLEDIKNIKLYLKNNL
ncbi:MAG: hypothetical protein WAZ12_03925 [Candidatus Absconditicoccaceae bacterium]